MRFLPKFLRKKKSTPDGHSKALPPRVHTTHEMHGSTLIFHSDSIKSCPLTQENVSAYSKGSAQRLRNGFPFCFPQEASTTCPSLCLFRKRYSFHQCLFFYIQENYSTFFPACQGRFLQRAAAIFNSLV